MPRVAPFVMFQRPAAEAVAAYAALFPDSAVEPAAHDDKGAPLLWQLTLAGQRLMVLESPAVHEFDLTPSFSMQIDCDSAEEVDRYHDALAPGGKVLMPLDRYEFAERYVWLVDRFGLSWQIRSAG